MTESIQDEDRETQALVAHLMATAPEATPEKARLFAKAVAWFQLSFDRQFSAGLLHYDFVSKASIQQINWITPEGLTLAGVSAQNEESCSFLMFITQKGLVPTEQDIAVVEKAVSRDDRSTESMLTAIVLHSVMNQAKKIAEADDVGLRQLAIKKAIHIRSAISGEAKKLKPREGVSPIQCAIGESIVRLADRFATAVLRKTHEPPEDKIQVILNKFAQMRSVMIARGWDVRDAIPDTVNAPAEVVPA